MPEAAPMQLDLDSVVAAKFPDKKIPRWIMSWLKRFIHQDFINAYLAKGYDGVEFCAHTAEYLDVKVDVEGLENLEDLPQDALATFASNHPLGGIDGLTLAGIIGRKYDNRIRILVNDFLMHVKPLASLCIPINKTGAQSRDLPAKVKEIYNSDCQVLVFPAGLCSRKIDGKIQDIPWSKNFVKMSVQTGRWIVPVHFIGKNSKRFYNVASLCKKLKLKFNFAMLFLPDEMYRAQHGTFKVIFGKPLPPSTFDGSKTAAEWAQWLREHVYQL